jgi:hypothetical protein
MSSNLATVAPKETDPHDIFVIDPDVVLAARADHAPARPAPDAVSPPAAPQTDTVADMLAGASAPSVDATFRATAADAIKVPKDRPAASGRVRRALISFLLVLGSLVAVTAWKHYGDAAVAMATSWMPKLTLASSPPQPKPAETGQPSAPVLQATATDPAPAQPAPGTTQPAPGVTPPVATQQPDSAQLLQTMAQQIEELKASIAELKTGQAQLSRDMAKTAENKSIEARTVQTRVAEPNPRPKLAATPPPRPAVAPARKPRPAYPPMEAGITRPLPPPAPAPVMLQPSAPPPMPAEDTAQSEFGPVIRPPMPLR